jgi:phage terminase small subunit
VAVSEAVGNPMRERFAREILKDGNATRAAQRAGYRSRAAATQLLQIPEVVDRIKKLHRSQIRRLQLEADEVIQAWSRIARFDPRRLFDEGGALLPPREWPEDVALCIQSIEVEERFEGRGEDRQRYLVHKIKFNDRMGALNSLGRYHNLFKEEAQEVGRGMAQEADILRRMEAGRARALARMKPAIDGEVLSINHHAPVALTAGK